MIVRRERAHPGAQLSFTDHDGHRFQSILTDQPGSDRQLERDHRGRARVEDHIRNDKDTGLRNLPFRDFEHNQVWLEIVRIAHDLIAWTQRYCSTGELAKAEPKRLRYRLLHIAARLAFHARTATLHLPATWPWATHLALAFKRLRRAARTSLTGSARPPRQPPQPRRDAPREACPQTPAHDQQHNHRADHDRLHPGHPRADTNPHPTLTLTTHPTKTRARSGLVGAAALARLSEASGN